MDTVHEGQVLAGKYRVERVLGKGGMGMVVAAMHQQLEQRVALKFLLPEGIGDSDSRTRFLREARAAVRLKSEHVARVLDVGTMANDTPYIVMEFLEGHDLHDLLEAEQRLRVEEAVDYVLQACEAIAEAHAIGIIHRDLKPANLFLTRRNDGSACVKVLDFGISKVTSNEPAAHRVTHGATLLGTPHYMSPEQLRSSRDVDARADIWSLGMILHELLVGEVAFLRDSLPDLCAAILLEPLPPPRALRPDLPEALEQVIVRALAKSPDDRPQTLADFARDLAPFVPHGDAAATRVASILGVTSPRPPASPRAPAAPEARPSPGRFSPAETAVCAPRAPAHSQSPDTAPSGSPPEADEPASAEGADEASGPDAHSLPFPSSGPVASSAREPRTLPSGRALPVARSARLVALVTGVLALMAVVVIGAVMRARSARDAGAPDRTPASALVAPVVAPAADGGEVAIAPKVAIAQPEMAVVEVTTAPAPGAASSAAVRRPSRPAPTGRGPAHKPGLSSDFGERK